MPLPNDSYAMHNGERVRILYVCKRNPDTDEPTKYLVRYVNRKKNRTASVPAHSLTPCHD